MIFLTLAAIALILLSIWWCYLYCHYFQELGRLPISWTMLPIFGHILLVRNPIDAYWIAHNLLLTLGKRRAYRGAVGFVFGLYVAEPEFLEKLMTHSSASNKSTLYEYTHSWLGTGLLNSNGEKWHIRRKLLTPAYHFKILENFIDVFDKNSNILVDKLRLEQGNERFDIAPFISLCTLDIICETAMGTTVNAQLESDSDYVKATHELTRLVVERSTNIFKIWDLTYRLLPAYFQEKKMVEIVHNYTRQVIATRKREIFTALNNQSENKIDSNEVGKKKIPFLDLLLQTSFRDNQFQDEDIAEEVNTFMFEGHDTVSAAISFCIYNISKHPAIQARLIVEQKEIFEDNPNREIEYNDMQQMKYLEMVIKESMRLYPSVPLIGRKVSKDIFYQNMTIKEGSEIAIGIYSAHHNPDVYPNPERFDPERFTPDECAKRHPFAYLPFSAGFRNCIGQKFAMLELKSTISKLLKHFEFTDAPNSELKLKSTIVLSSATGVHVGIRKRNWVM